MDHPKDNPVFPTQRLAKPPHRGGFVVFEVEPPGSLDFFKQLNYVYSNVIHGLIIIGRFV
jgi:hypothetical protein